MATLEKIIKAFEAIKGSGGVLSSSNATSVNRAVLTSIDQSNDSASGTMAVIANTISQGSAMLSKKDHLLTSREKIFHCSTIVEAITCAKNTDVQKLLAIGFETLFVLINDHDPDVRMTSNEALNKIIRSLVETHIGKIQVELLKEIKKNASVKSSRAALYRFSKLCHHIRPQKCRAYMQSLLPCLIKLSKHQDELLQETLAQCLEKIMPCLGRFTNDNEIRNLIKAFLPNLNSPSSSLRRSCISSLVCLPKHSRKPQMFLSWLTNQVLHMCYPNITDIFNSQLLGCLNCLRSICPSFAELNAFADSPEASINFHITLDIAVTKEVLIQVYEVCLYYCSHHDHNVVIASLELLQAFFENLPCPLLKVLMSSDGIPRSYLPAHADHQSEISRSSSMLKCTFCQLFILICGSKGQLTIAPSLMDDELSFDFESKFQLEDEIVMEEKNTASPLLISLKSEEDALVDPDITVDIQESNNLYSSIEIGQVTGTDVLFGRKDLSLSVEERSQEKRRAIHTAQTEKLVFTEKVDSPLFTLKIIGNIGSMFDEDVPLKYLVRYLAASYLLQGHMGSLLSDKTVRVSIKVLAINCIGCTISILPSLLSESLFIQDVATETEFHQHLDDIIRYHSHPDPQLCSSIGILIGNFIRANLFLLHASSVVARGALSGLSYCIPDILHSWHATCFHSIDPYLVRAASSSYWLVKVDLCELLSKIPCIFVDYIDVSLNIHLCKESIFSYRVFYTILLPLLEDCDYRVRSSAATTIVKLLPDLFSSQLCTDKVFSSFVSSGHLWTKQNYSMYGALPPVRPFDIYINNQCKTENDELSLFKELRIKESLSGLLHFLCTRLINSTSKYTVRGCLQVLSLLCNAYPPVLYLNEWNCFTGIYHTDNESVIPKDGLLNVVLCLGGESVFAGDLSVQQHVLNIAVNVFTGMCIYLCETNSENKKEPWSFFNSHQFSHTGNIIIQHIARILCIYMHVIEETMPSVRTLLPHYSSTTVASPVKRKSKFDLSDSNRVSSLGRSDKPDNKDKEKKVKLSGYGYGHFTDFPEFVKLYDAVKNAYHNYKLSLEDDVRDKVCGLLQVTLKSLGHVLEVCSLSEFSHLAEEILIYLKSTMKMVPAYTVFCGQQLLKCLFGSNTKAVLEQNTDKLTEKLYPSLPEDLYEMVIELPLNQTHSDLSCFIQQRKKWELANYETLQHKGSTTFSKFSTKIGDKVVLSSYIRLFEPLVIEALQLYTVTNNIQLQCSVLQLLINLVQIRVNYCLLDSDQIFIGYIIKQFEYIEEGQIPDAEKLIPSIFKFLVMLSYERYHSKSIIGVPKIIQLCDGLLASGQPPLSHCILALQPLVEDIFLERSANSSVDQQEFETQKEVIATILLRLAQYYQVLDLIALVLQTLEQTNKERWFNFSQQVFSRVLQLLSDLLINFDSMESTVDVERWVSCSLLLLRALLVHCSPETILTKLDELDISMSYGNNEDSDPLNVSQSKMCAHVAFARFLFEVVRVSMQELKTVHISRLYTQSTAMTKNSQLFTMYLTSSSDFLVQLIHHFLLLLIYMIKSGQWKIVFDVFKELSNSEPYLFKEIIDCFLFTSCWYPSLFLYWCNILTLLNISTEYVWTTVLGTSQRKAISSESFSADAISSNSLCFSLEFLRRSGLLIFSEFVVKHMNEGEWLTWLIVQHISDVVMLQDESPLVLLLKEICNSQAASVLLIQAVNTKCNLYKKAEFIGAIISLVTRIHSSQYGALISFLIEYVLPLPYIQISKRAAALCNQKLQELKNMSKEQQTNLLPLEECNRISLIMLEKRLSIRHHELMNSLSSFMGENYNEIAHSKKSELSLLATSKSCKLDFSWYLQLVKKRCSFGEGNARECSLLISHLDYAEIINVMSSKKFNFSLLQNMFQLGFSATIKDNQNCSSSSNASYNSGDSEDGSNSSCYSESPLYSACKTVLLQQISFVVSSLPKPHNVFCPGGGNKYSEKLCKIIGGDDTISMNVVMLSPALTEFLVTNSKLPSAEDFSTDTANLITKFAIFNMEHLHWRAFLSSLSVDEVCISLNCVNEVLRTQCLFNQIARSDRITSASSMIASLYAIVSYFVSPVGLPCLSSAITQSLAGSECSKLVACRRLIQLIVWIEVGGAEKLPQCIGNPLKSLIVGLSRLPAVNAVVRLPPELWNLGWSHTFYSEAEYTVPQIPVELLQEPDVLQQFIFRILLLGWTSKQQFEETWMTLLSVLSNTPIAETPEQEIPFINLSLSLAVKGITALLLQTLLLPTLGNPYNSKVLHVSWIKSPAYFQSLPGKRLKNLLNLFKEKLCQVDHIMYIGSYKFTQYSLLQISVDYMVTSINSSLEDKNSSLQALDCSEFIFREKELVSSCLDVPSCLYFLHDLYSSWLQQNIGLCSSVVCEVIKSMCCLCDLFTTSLHYLWILETLIPLHSNHPVEDHLTTQYIIIASSKCLAGLRAAKQEISSYLSDGVFHIVETGLQNGQVSVRTCSLQALLFLLQAPLDLNQNFVTLAMNYFAKYNSGNNMECEEHEVAFWELLTYILEHFQYLSDPNLYSNSLQTALIVATSVRTTPAVLVHVLNSLQQLVLVHPILVGTTEVVLKLAMDLITNSSSRVSFSALSLYATSLSVCASQRTDEPLDMSKLLQFLEKISILFDRIRVSYPYEAEILASLVGPCLLDVLPANQILNKVIMEYISSHQPHPHLLAETLFHIFESAMKENGESLVQEWVLLSLNNFTQRSPMSLAVWCLTCFFVSASTDKWLRAAFPTVQARVGKLEARDIRLFCLAGANFRQSLLSNEQKDSFDSVFKSASTPGCPFDLLLNYIKT